jgi:uncharacterized repeat protein (TIGR02059 family)
VRIIKDLIPFQQETVGTNRLRKFLSLALIIGLLQTFSWTYQVIEAPKANAAYRTGSANFNTDKQYISAPNNSDFAVGTGDFTVEWWQNMSNPPTTGQIYSWPRPWIVNSATSNQFGLSIEPNGDNPLVYFWLNGPTLIGTLKNFSTNYQNVWAHFAVTRTSNAVRVFVNGSLLGDCPASGYSCANNFSNPYNFTDGTTALSIGSQAGSAGTIFPGQITNFHFVKGTSLYSSNFTTPTQPTTPVTNTKLLLLNKGSSGLLTDSSGLNKTITNNANVTYSSAAPNWAVDSVAPTLSSATLASNGLSIALNFSENLSDLTAAPSNFSVQLNGSETRTITSISLSGSTATLNLATAVTANTDLTFTYTDPTAGDDVNALQDDYGNDVATISNYRVTNSLSSSIDSALNLNGSNQYAATPDNSALDITGNFSGEAWAYPESATAVGTVFGKWGAYMLQAKSGNWYYWLQGSTGWLGVNTGIPVTPNQWSHVAFTRANSTNEVKFYLNGRLVYVGTADTVGTGNINNSNAPLVIGSHNTDTDFFRGSIDEVKIWNVVRSESNIQSDLKSYGGALSSGLVAYYDFNELIATKIFNRSTGGSTDLNLTITASPSISSNRIFETSTVQAYSIVQFKRSYLVASGGWTSPANVSSMRYLVVGGGGGGGGGYNGGGGGAGGYRETNTAILPNTVYNIEVGVGGIGAIYGYLPTAGGDSAIRNNLIVTDSITASGGGSGATEQGSFGSTSAAASSGGSGGGGVHGGGLTPGTGNKGGFTPSEGNTGGSGSSTGIVNAGEGYFAGGGGGGAGGAGGAAQTSSTGVPGNGGSGVTTNITGSALLIAGGGAGAGRFVTSSTFIQKSGTASAGGGAGACTSPCTGSVDTGTAGTANTGGGGGGGSDNLGKALGGLGGTGFIVIRYITNKPTIITQPTDDTSTVGAVDTFTISTSAAPSPLTKSVQWQFTADTTTAVVANITGWTNVSTGTGFTTDSFTTAALTKAINKYRYRAIVTFSDTATISSIETSSVVTLTVNDSITITSDTSTITRKYGDTQTVRSIAYSGGTTSTGAVGTSTSHTVNTPFGPLANGKIYVDTSTSTAKFKVDTGTVVGTYYETITVTDFKGAVSSYTQKVVVNPADTLTVQADTLTAITYNPNGMTINPTASYTGLVNSDTQSAITLTFKSSTLASCANGGLCNLGDTGPGGGTIFYDAGSTQSWGRYIEASPIDWYTVAKGGNGTENVTWCSNTNYFITGLVDAIGYGLANKQTMAASCDLSSGYKNTAPGMLWVTNGGAPGGYSGGGKTDWFLPSLSEMDALNNYSGGSLLPQKYYWIAENTNATISPTPAYSCCSQSWNYRAIGGATKSSAYPIRPMRYVTPDLSLTSYNSTTPPTNAGTYTINPSSLVLANNVDTLNYVSVIYRSSTLVINKAVQDSLTITSKLAPYNGGTSTMKLTTIGGTDTGTVTYAIATGGTASGCSVSTNVLSFTSAGTCKVVATKAATINYLVAYSDTVTITLSAFISHQPVQTQQYPNQIPINGKNSLETTTATIPVITSVTYQPRYSPAPYVFVEASYTINGSGFTGATRVLVNFVSVPFYLNSDTNINITATDVPNPGPLFIECSDGRSGPSPFYFFTPSS